jgi:hypothetical protein
MEPFVSLNPAIVAFTLLVAAGAEAAPATSSIGNVEILGKSYTVSRLYDSDHDPWQQTFDILSPTITFTNEGDARAAATALLATFGASFDWNPGSIDNGISIVYSADEYNFFYVTVCCGLNEVNGAFGRSRYDARAFPYAQFSAVTSSVPEPETYTLMMVGLGLLRWRGAKRTQG